MIKKILVVLGVVDMRQLLLIKNLQTKTAVTFLTHNISGIGGVRYVCIKMILAHVIILAGGKSCRNFSQGFSYWKVTQKFTHFARWNAKYACATLTCPNLNR